MRLFWKLAQLSFRRQITYRAATLAGLATNIFFGLLRAAVMVALYDNQAEVAGFTLRDAITYTGISQAVIAYLSLFGWYDIVRSVHTGEIAGSLLKPMSFFNYWLGQDAGRALAQLLLRGAPIMVFYALYYDITVPQGAGQWLGLGAALLLGWLVSFAYRFLLNLAAFWTPNAIGIGRLGFMLAWFLSGFMMPLDFFPEWFVRLCYLTPFPHLIYTSVQVYLGQLQGAEIITALWMQALWAGALILAGQLILSQGVRRLVIQGG